MNGVGTAVLTISTAALATVLCAGRSLPVEAFAQQPPAGAPPVQPGRPTDQDRRDRIAEVIAKAIDQTHGGAAYRTHPVFQCELEMTAGDLTIAGKLSFQINSRGARLDMRDGSSIVFDGQACSVSPANSGLSEDVARLRLMTLRNLVASPFMTGDQHAKVSSFRASMVMGSDADAFKVQWPLIDAKAPPSLIAYAESRTHELTVIGCDSLASLLGLPVGEQAVRSVVFTDLTRIEGLLLPMTWWLYDWTEAATVRGERLGTVKISNVRFPKSGEVTFAIAKPTPPKS